MLKNCWDQIACIKRKSNSSGISFGTNGERGAEQFVLHRFDTMQTQGHGA